MKRIKARRDPVFADALVADRYAKRHRAMQEKFGEEFGEKLRAKGFQSGRVLDAGCGFGRMLIVLALKFPTASFVGIDLSEPLLSLAEEECGQLGLGARLRFRKADVCEIPYPDESFDVVFNINMLHLVNQPQRMLNELERVLTKNGFLFIVDIRRSWIGLLEREFLSALTVEESRRILAESSIRPGAMTSTLLWWRYEG